TVEEARAANLVVKGPGEYAVDLTKLVRGKSAVAVGISGMEANPGATISRAALEIEYSGTAPRADAGGAVFQLRPGAIRLDGGKSALPDGGKSGLRYSWTIARPAWGSPYRVGEKIGDGPLVLFSLRAPGYYVVKLRVTNPATGESDEDTAGVETALRPHPRLQVDEGMLAQIRLLRSAKDPLWERFYNRLKSRPAAGGQGMQANLWTSYLLAHLVTGEKELFDAAWALAAPNIYKNGKDRSGGVVRLIEIYGGDQHKAAFQGGQFAGQMALLYDWGYARLTPEQRQDIIGWLNEAVDYNYRFNRSAQSVMRNDGAAVTYGLAAAAYATLGENPEAGKVLGWFRDQWDQTLAALDVIGKGGASGEGNAYGASPTAASIIRAANLVYYASGEDLFLSHAFFRQKLLFDAFAAYPGHIGGPDAVVRYPDRPIVEQASIGGDGRRAASWHSAALRPNGLILSRRFRDTPEAEIWNWVYRQPAVDGLGDPGDPVAELLSYSPRPRLVKPSKLSFFDPSMGFVYIRSDWDSPDATWIAFWAGPHIDTHQHLDQGAFAIFKRRDLAPKTGHYDTTIRSSHGLGWYTRTVSANALLIGDPAEIFRGFNAGWGCDGQGNGPKLPAPGGGDEICPPNDGGQRTMTPLSLASQNAEMFETYRDVFDTARVVSFQDDGKAVTVVADITNAYNNPRFSSAGNKPKVARVWRRLVYLRGADILLVGDTVESTNPAFEKKWLLHALDRIETGGAADEARVVVDDTDRSDKYQTTFDLRKGYATLLVKTLFPAQFRYRKIGGREPADTPHPDLYVPGKNAGHLHRHVKDFWVKDFSEGVIPNHKSVNWAPEAPLEIAARDYIPVYGPGYGRWRLEVEPATPAKTDFFLNLLKPSLDPNAKLPVIRKKETADSFGAEIDSGGNRYTIMFGKDSLDRPRIEISAAR
ncbi:MAG: hypothetical protein Q8N47_04420, partial [Bryobacterales bacterium]|nr:hypothetical protein [Bryobacterales bacterium]